MHLQMSFGMFVRFSLASFCVNATKFIIVDIIEELLPTLIDIMFLQISPIYATVPHYYEMSAGG